MVALGAAWSGDVAVAADPERPAVAKIRAGAEADGASLLVRFRSDPAAAARAAGGRAGRATHEEVIDWIRDRTRTGGR